MSVLTCKEIVHVLLRGQWRHCQYKQGLTPGSVQSPCHSRAASGTRAIPCLALLFLALSALPCLALPFPLSPFPFPPFPFSPFSSVPFCSLPLYSQSWNFTVSIHSLHPKYCTLTCSLMFSYMYLCKHFNYYLCIYVGLKSVSYMLGRNLGNRKYNIKCDKIKLVFYF